MKKKNYYYLLILLFLTNCSGNRNNTLIEHSGTIETTNVILSSQVAGTMKEIFLHEGSSVYKGDTIAIVDSEKYELLLKQSYANKAIAEAQLHLLQAGGRKEDKKKAGEMLKQTEANFILIKKDKDRMDKLIQSKSITQKQYDEVATKFDIAKSSYEVALQNVKKIKSARPEEIERAKASLLLAQAAVDLNQKIVNDCYIVSPLNGQIVNQFIEVGETASLFSSLFKITDLTVAELDIFITEKELAFVKFGQSVNVEIDSFTDKVFEGKVTFISPEAEFTPKNIQTKDERTKLVFRVRITIPNPEQILKPGMPADAVIKFQD